MNVTIKDYVMYMLLRMRDIVGYPFKPKKELKKLKIRKDDTILDFGCGVGSFTIPLAQIISKGTIYALDKQQYATETVERRAIRKGIQNIKTIISEGDTSLENETVDVAMLFGVLPEIKDKERVLNEMYRILKPEGFLSTRFCFHISKEEIIELMEKTGLFTLIKQKGKILNYRKKEIIKEIDLSVG